MIARLQASDEQSFVLTTPRDALEALNIRLSKRRMAGKYCMLPTLGFLNQDTQRTPRMREVWWLQRWHGAAGAESWAKP